MSYTPIINLDVLSIAEFVCSKSKTNIDFGGILLRQYFTQKKVAPVVQLLYKDEIDNTVVLKQKFREYGENSLNVQKVFITNLIQAIEKQNSTNIETEQRNIEMTNLINIKETTEDLKQQLDDAKREISLLKNGNSNKLSIMQAQKNKIKEKVGEIIEMKNNRKLMEQEIKFKNEFLLQKECTIQALMPKEKNN